METTLEAYRENAAVHFRKRLRQRYGAHPGITATQLWDLACEHIPAGNVDIFRSIARLSRKPVRRLWAYDQEAGPTIYLIFDHTHGFPLTVMAPGWRVSTQHHWTFTLPEPRA